MPTLLLGILKYVMTGFCGDASPLCPGDQGRLDIIIKDFLRLLRCTTRAFFPRCDFTNGLTNLTLTTANENSGIIFMLSLLWATETGRTLMKALKGHSVDIAILLLHFSVPTGIPVLDQARRVLASKNRE